MPKVRRYSTDCRKAEREKRREARLLKQQHRPAAYSSPPAEFSTIPRTDYTIDVTARETNQATPGVTGT
jgi:hypothetical protein